MKKNFYRILTDDELFVLLSTDRNAEAEFYRRYKIKVKHLLRSYRLNSLEREDLIQEGMIGLFRAIQTYDPSRGIQFSTYATVCIRNRILGSLDLLWHHKKNIDQNRDIEEIVSARNPESDTIEQSVSDFLREAVEALEGLEKEVLDRYMEGKSYKTIAGELAISTKKVDNILMKIKAGLSERIRRRENPDTVPDDERKRRGGGSGRSD